MTRCLSITLLILVCLSHHLAIAQTVFLNHDPAVSYCQQSGTVATLYGGWFNTSGCGRMDHYTYNPGTCVTGNPLPTADGPRIKNSLCYCYSVHILNDSRTCATCPGNVCTNASSGVNTTQVCSQGDGPTAKKGGKREKLNLARLRPLSYSSGANRSNERRLSK